jgi:hypothetical protein
MNPITKKIAALLALAASAAGTPEGANAQGKAEALAARHGLDLGSIQPSGEVVDLPVEESITAENSALWRASLAWGIAKYAGVELVRYSGTARWSIIGRKADIELWRGMFARAESEIDAEAKRYVAGLSGWTSARSEGDTFRKAAASGFRDRLSAYKAEAEASEQGRSTAAALAAAGRVETAGTTTALVLASREGAVKAELARRHPRLVAVAVKSGGSSGARRAGYAFGSSMGVHRANIGR